MLKPHLFVLSALLASVTAADKSSIPVTWLDGGAPEYLGGVTFGLPWPRGKHAANATTFAVEGGDIESQSWITAYWPDGSVKWSGHAIGGGEAPSGGYTVTASDEMVGNGTGGEMRVTQGKEGITVDTGKVEVSFPLSGSAIVSSIRAGGKTVGRNGRLVLRSQDGIADDDGDNAADISRFSFESKISNVTVSSNNRVRALVTVRGTHSTIKTTQSTHADWLPFTLRFYLYKNSESIRIIHTIIYDGASDKDFITALGLRFDVPLAGEEQYNRHVRIAGVDGGMLHESVQGITGLRRDPGVEVQKAQFEGKELPDSSTWDQRVTTRLQWVPTWGDYRLTQLTPDGFTLRKRTKPGQSWVNIPGGTRAGGLLYLGGATVGGLAMGLRDFWKKYPTSMDVTGAASDTGSVTMWLWSPQAEPMDLRPYHDGLGQDTYAKQLDALEITYEDYEDEYNTPYGVARTNELYLYAFPTTPPAQALTALTNHTNNPPVLVAPPETIRDSKAIGSYWDVPSAHNSSPEAAKIESNMEFLIDFYTRQVEQRRWYGFWDHGDMIHSYDPIRHTWRYDIGGYAWDNSELSPDLFFWGHFLRTGSSAAYRLAHDQARHGAEVDSYHLGPFKGLGTRHGVQHWSDSAKQARISTPVYRKPFFYVSGGDERTGELISEVLDVTDALARVDARRKVRDPDVPYTLDPRALYLDFGTDWAGIAQAYLIEWERRGPAWEASRDRLVAALESYPRLKNGFVTGEALYDSETGVWSSPPTDPNNAGAVSVSHLSGVFGVLETIDQLLEHMNTPNITAPFLDAFLDFCYFYGAPKNEQRARYGRDFGSLNLKQGHSRFTAYAAYKRSNASLVDRVWSEFLGDGSKDGLAPDAPWWEPERVGGSDVLVPVDEAAWVSTNAAALYGVAGVENLALVGSPGKRGGVSGNATMVG